MKQPGHRVREHQLLAGQRIGQATDQTLAAGEHDHHEADHDARKGQRQRQHRDQPVASAEAVALQEDAGDARLTTSVASGVAAASARVESRLDR